MVCHRCFLAVENVLNELGIPFQKVTIGEIHLLGQLDDSQINALANRLGDIGLELLDNRSKAMMEKIKQLIIKKARNEVDLVDARKNLSNYLSDNLFLEYTYLSSLFSSIEGRTIEKFFIKHRIERVKELLVYGEKTLSQIAADMEYSSISHLSRQFKKVTGLTPTHFIKIASEKRELLDKI